MDAHWDPNKALGLDELRALVLSADPDERMLAAAMYDLPEELVEILADDSDFAVVEAAMMQRTATEQMLQASVDRFPDLREQVSLHDNAPIALMSGKPCAYATGAQLRRFLEAKHATAPQTAAFINIASRASSEQNATVSLDKAWLETRRL